LWWTLTVQGTDFNFVEVESALGVTISYSLGRWVVINVLGIALITATVIVWLWALAATHSLFFIGSGILFALFDAASIGMFVWSMTPPRKAR
jgi:hypothetical protein